MMHMTDLRCTNCGDGTIGAATAVKREAAPRGIQRKAYLCSDCGEPYDVVWGVPFLGRYERSEIFGLIEIAANIINRGRFGVTPEVVADWEQLLSDYHDAPDKEAFVASAPSAQSPYLLNRYGEWVVHQELAKGLDLTGRNVLDLGAGLGFDAQRLHLRGANVTALEFSPVLAEWGASNFPHIRWIGGLADVLPFKSGTFDAVFCNAALHHFRDIPASIAESLRVLKPGGVLNWTTCNSFRSDKSDELSEARIFDAEPAVLMGVNERVPKFSEFASTLKASRKAQSEHLHAHSVWGSDLGWRVNDTN